MVVLAILPIAVGSWAMAHQAGDAQLGKADAALQPPLRRAVTAYAQKLGEAGQEAEKLASQARRALANGDRSRLRAITAAQDKIVVLRDTRPFLGTLRPSAADVTANVALGTKELGTIVIQFPFDDRLLAELASRARIAPPSRLAIAANGRILAGPAKPGTPIHARMDRPRDVRLEGSSYRALGADLPDEPGKALVVLAPREPIQADVENARRRIYLGAGGLLGLVALLAYALAPAIARGRLSQRQRAQAARVLSHVGDGVFLADQDGRIGFWNPAAETITGIAAEEAIGRPLAQVLPGWATVEALIPVGSHADPRDRTGPRTVPLEIAGRELWLSFSGADFDEGRVYTFRDLSEERRVEELKMDFVTTVSHELRTPLSAITGAAMTLRERGDSLPEETQRQLLSLVTEQSDRLAALVDDILVSGQLAHGNLVVAEDSFDPLELTRAVIEDTGTALVDGHSLAVSAPEALPRVTGDAAKARQVLTNLIENAAKYSPNGGAIDVRLEPNGRYVRFAVRDEGLGIPKREQERIFEKFYRVDPLMTRGISGTGLGLYICRELVHHMGGRMAVASTPGVGSTFSFELPIVAANEEPDVTAHRRRLFA